ncbi:MAG: alpha/beta hydrolase [Myxococcales bacterium]|nr:alpha/beta hydrolase [Myxococcales bacterium]
MARDVTFDGTGRLRLHGTLTEPTGHAPRKGAALVVHGFDDHSGRYGEVVARLVGLGLTTLAFDYRGHGRSEGKRGHCDRFDDYLGDVDAAIAVLRAEAGDDAKLALVGHSHGSLVLLRALCEPARVPRGVAGVVLFSPFLGIALKVNPLKEGLARALNRLLPRVGIPTGIPASTLSHDAERVRAAGSDPLRHGVATPRWLAEAEAAQAFVLEHAPALAVPSLWQVAGGDQLASVAATQRVIERAGGEKTLHLYDGLAHEVWNERDADRVRVLDDLTAWLAPRFA